MRSLCILYFVLAGGALLTLSGYLFSSTDGLSLLIWGPIGCLCLVIAWDLGNE